MKRLIFVLLMLTYSSAYAEWLAYDHHTSGITFYYDKSSINRGSSISQMWSMKNLPSADTFIEEGNSKRYRYRSIKTLFVFDCRGGQKHGYALFRVLRMERYSGFMGSQSIVHSFSAKDKEWMEITLANHDSEARMLWEIACGKRF